MNISTLVVGFGLLVLSIAFDVLRQHRFDVKNPRYALLMEDS